MPLTTGRLGERRTLGGTRGAIRNEIRRAKRQGFDRLAEQLAGGLARENLRRAAAGDSNIGSADSDIREGRFQAARIRQQQREAMKLLSTTGEDLERTSGYVEQSAAGSTVDVAQPSSSAGTTASGTLADARSSSASPASVSPVENNPLRSLFKPEEPTPGPNQSGLDKVTTRPRSLINGELPETAISDATQRANIARARAGLAPELSATNDEVKAYVEYLDETGGDSIKFLQDRISQRDAAQQQADTDRENRFAGYRRDAQAKEQEEQKRKAQALGEEMVAFSRGRTFDEDPEADFSAVQEGFNQRRRLPFDNTSRTRQSSLAEQRDALFEGLLDRNEFDIADRRSVNPLNRVSTFIGAGTMDQRIAERNAQIRSDVENINDLRSQRDAALQVQDEKSGLPKADFSRIGAHFRRRDLDDRITRAERFKRILDAGSLNERRSFMETSPFAQFVDNRTAVQPPLSPSRAALFGFKFRTP